MSKRRITGRDIDIMLGAMMIHVEAFSVTISDGKGVAKTKGAPNGRVRGEVGAEGEIEVDTANFLLIMDEAKSAGSFSDMDTFDIVANADTTDEQLNLEVFGCDLSISDLLGVDPKGGEKQKHKIKFNVTSPDFIRINGTPYLSLKDTKDFT